MKRCLGLSACLLLVILSAPAMAQGTGESAVARACAGMGLHPGEEPFIACERSLAQTMSEAGLTPRAAAPSAAATGSDPAAGFYESYQRGDQMTSVRRACAQIGAVPGTQAFQTCVGNLNMTINDDDMDAVMDH
jgi:hypothetical protein